MGWVSSLAVYAIIWWVCLFAVLPWGVHTISQEDVSRGHAESAPRRPRIVIKMAVTSVVAGLVWVVVYLALTRGWISYRE